MSGVISVQDQNAYLQAGVNNVVTGAQAAGIGLAAGTGAFGTSDYAGPMVPDVVGVLKIEQAWGSLQGSAAVHNNHAAYYGATEITGHPTDKYGYAGQIALSLKNLPTGPGDVFNIQGVYTKGATRYNIQDLSNAGSSTIYGRSNAAGVFQSIGFGIAPDTVFGPGGQQQQIETYGGRGGFTHNWDAFWNTSAYGAYASVRYGGGGQALICGVGGVGGSFRAAFGAGITNCNPDFNIAQAGLITRWTPVKNLTFSADVTYIHIDQKMAGVITAPASASVAKPAAVYQLRDQDNVLLLLRAQRNF